MDNGTDVNVSNSNSVAIKSQSVGKGKKKWPVYFPFGGISGVKIFSLAKSDPHPLGPFYRSSESCPRLLPKI